MSYATIKVMVTDVGHDFTAVKKLGEHYAAKELDVPMLIAWFDAVKGEASPQVPECTGEPGWLAYAKGHGIRLMVDINNGSYLFAYTDAG